MKRNPCYSRARARRQTARSMQYTTSLSAASNSFQIRDKTANGRPARGRRRFARQNRLKRPLQVLHRRRQSRLAKVDIAIVDSSAIEQLAARIKYRGLRSDLRPRQLHQLMLRIAQAGEGIGILVQMFLDHLRRFVWIEI